MKARAQDEAYTATSCGGAVPQPRPNDLIEWPGPAKGLGRVHA